MKWLHTPRPLLCNIYSSSAQASKSLFRRGFLASTLALLGVASTRLTAKVRGFSSRTFLSKDEFQTFCHLPPDQFLLKTPGHPAVVVQPPFIEDPSTGVTEGHSRSESWTRSWSQSAGNGRTVGYSESRCSSTGWASVENPKDWPA